jgi:hypothetical protein
VFRNQASRLFQDVENRSGAEDPIAFGVADAIEHAAGLQLGDSTHNRIVGNLEPVFRLARAKEGICTK